MANRPGAPQRQEAGGAEPLVVPLEALNREALPLAGGKAANLGELMAAGFAVPPGFCVTTAAYRQTADSARLDALLAAFSEAGGATEDTASDDLAARARAALLGAPCPEPVAAAVREAYAALSAAEPARVAVRSSATAEDLPEASFAGQQDTFLDVSGEAALLDAVRRCWASLWTDRAVAYREANGIDHQAVQLAVVVQVMVPAATAGVLFTANPLTGCRREAVIDAVPGLGEALVSGRANPDHFVVDRAMRITTHTPAPPAAGSDRERTSGTADPSALAHSHTPTHPYAPSLSDAQVLDLARVGLAVESHYDAPQDIEWAYAPDGALWLLQARPITTLFPLPEEADSDAPEVRLYFSFNVAQGVLRPLTPMGIAMFRRTMAGMAGLAGFQMDPSSGPCVLVEAGGRLFLDVTVLIGAKVGARLLTTALRSGEPLTGQVIEELLAGDPRFSPQPGRPSRRILAPMARFMARTHVPLRAAATLLRPEDARVAAIAAADRLLTPADEQPASPAAAVDRVEQILDRIPVLVPSLMPLAIVGLASFALAQRLAGPLGAGEDALRLSRGLPHNPTTEMNLELWAVASRLRGDAEAAPLLAAVPPPELASRYLVGELPASVQEEVGAFLNRYGFRGVAEIDVGLPRWSDDPTYLFVVIANYLRLADPEQAPDAQFQRAASEAEAAASRILEKARTSGPMGWLRAALLRFLIRRTRALAGLREAPKFYVVRAFGQCRQLLRSVGEWLVEQGRLERVEDIFFLNVVGARRAIAGEDCRELVADRRARYDREMRRRRVPRVLLSDGTTFYGGAAQGAAGKGELVGTAASPGVYRGPARVIMEPAGARLEPGEVLVAPSTDPGWTPLFLTAGALVMEMGGMISHGAVVAREYGIPAVVGLPGATTAIRTGQQVTVDGSRGVVALPAVDSPPETEQESRGPQPGG